MISCEKRRATSVATRFCTCASIDARTPDDWVSMPPGTFARLNPQPEPEQGWYVQGDEWFAFDPERYLSDGIRYTTHACSGGKP